jgi:hypothetical protein
VEDLYNPVDLATTFSLINNATVKLDPFSKEANAAFPLNPVLTLNSDDGKKWEYHYPRNSGENNSNSGVIDKINRWNNEILGRRLPHDFPIVSFSPTTKRQNWTTSERNNIEREIIDFIQENKDAPKREDWDRIAQLHNDKFEGYMRILDITWATTVSRSLRINGISATRGGGLTKKKGVYPARSAAEIQSILYKWPHIQQIIIEETTKVGGTVPVFNDCDTDLSDSESSESEEDDDAIDDDETVASRDGLQDDDETVDDGKDWVGERESIS